MSFSSTPLFLETSSVGEELESKRISLLRCVLEAGEEKVGSDAQHSAKSLKREYNDIIGQQDRLRRGRFTDPIHILPPELWISLVREIIDRPDGRCVDQLLILTLVSIEWHHAIVATSELWSDIYIPAGLQEGDMMAKLHISLYLSRDYPIRLVIEHPTRDWAHIMSKLRAHTHRVREIILGPVTTKDAIHVDPLNPSIDDILLSLGPLPNLRELSRQGIYRAEDSSLEMLFERTPAIESIRGMALPAQILLLPNFKRVVRIYSKSPLIELYPRLFQLPLLQELTLGRLGDEFEDDFASMVTHSSTAPTQALPIELHSFTYRQPQVGEYFLLLQASTSLTQLVTYIDWQLLPRLVSVVGKLSRLNSLEINLRCTRRFNMALDLADTQPLTNLKTLVIKDRAEKYLVKDEHFTQLFNFFGLCAPFLEDLSLILDNSYNINVEFLNSFSKLRGLLLQLENQTPDESFILRSDSLEVIRLYLSPAYMVHLCTTMRCKRLTSLNIHPLGKDGEVFPLVLEEEECSTVSFIFWADDWMNWNVRTLSHLRMVEFGEYAETVASDFCVHLTLRPTDCPALEELEFCSFPEWDCLFMMLERRNFLPNSSISPIRLIALPSLIHPCLRVPLVALLRGCYTTRPSNHEISLEGISELYFDESMCVWFIFVSSYS